MTERNFGQDLPDEQDDGWVFPHIVRQAKLFDPGSRVISPLYPGLVRHWECDEEILSAFQDDSTLLLVPGVLTYTLTSHREKDYK